MVASCALDAAFRCFYDGSPTPRNQLRMNANGQLTIDAGTAVDVGAADAAIHRYQAIFNGASSSVVTDGVASATVNAGASDLRFLSVASQFSGIQHQLGDTAVLVVQAALATAGELTSMDGWMADRYSL